jgi:hypothetical protein
VQRDVVTRMDVRAAHACRLISLAALVIAGEVHKGDVGDFH